jgi:hypothetical protein
MIALPWAIKSSQIMDSLDSYCSFLTLRLPKQNTHSSGFGDYNANDEIIFLTAGKKALFYTYLVF